MTRSHDTWVLLLVVSVLSTLLSVIVISTCLWICFKYCIYPSTFKRRQCAAACQQTFPPPQRERFDMGEIDACMNSIIQDQRGASGFPYDKTGTSEQLGYRPNVNVSVPVLPTPRSWTPSPPFTQTIHQRSLPNLFPGCHNGPRHHCCNALMHEDCFRVEKVSSPCQICSHKLRERLTYLQRYSRGNPKRNLARSSETNRLAYRPPTNTPICQIKEHYGTSISQGYEPSSDETQRVNIKRKSSSNHFNHFGKSLSHSVISRNKMESGSCSKSKYKENYVASKAEKFSGANTDKHTSSLSREQECMRNGKLHSPFRLFSLGKGNSYSSATLPGERMLEKLKRQNTVATFLETSSNSSSDGTSALNRTSRTYWKLFQPTIEDEIKQNGEEEARYDAAHSLSWDHLASDPSPVPEMLPKVEVDPAKATAIFYHENRIDEDNAIDRENIQINENASNATRT